jgi:hypothetical protein
VNGAMIKLMDKVSTYTLMVQNMKVNGKKINKTDKERKHGQTALVTKENINKERSLDMENSNGLTVQNMKVTLLIIIYTEKV